MGDALLEVGRYREAAEVYETMMGLGRDLFSLSRRAGLRSVRGDVDGAIQDLTRAIEAGRARTEPRESVAWAQRQLGHEHFLVGDLAAAEARYRDALATYPGYHRASAGLAQVRAAQGRDGEAVELYRNALAIIPLPEYAAPLGDVYTRLGRREDAKAQYALVEYIGGLSARAKVLYNRELAYFYADHDVKLDDALELSRKELEVRQDIYAHDVLAWALYKKGRAAEALPLIQVALSLGTRDPKLHFHAGLIHHSVHAGLIHHSVGDAEQARLTFAGRLPSIPSSARSTRSSRGAPCRHSKPARGDRVLATALALVALAPAGRPPTRWVRRSPGAPSVSRPVPAESARCVGATVHLVHGKGIGPIARGRATAGRQIVRVRL